MNDEEKLQLGFEIIAGMHAEIADQDMEYGRAETAEGLTPDPDCPPEYLEGHLRGVEMANNRINKQAPFIAQVAVDKLSEMGFELVRRCSLPVIDVSTIEMPDRYIDGKIQVDFGQFGMP